jgi:hypothetical protein
MITENIKKGILVIISLGIIFFVITSGNSGTVAGTSSVKDGTQEATIKVKAGYTPNEITLKAGGMGRSAHGAELRAPGAGISRRLRRQCQAVATGKDKGRAGGLSCDVDCAALARFSMFCDGSRHKNPIF